jgi:acetyl-CoA acyltransferase 1
MRFNTMAKAGIMSHLSKGAHRAASTLGSGRAQLLQKKHDDIVITFAKRTAMGRAKKGQLKDVPVDELLYSLFKVRLWSTLLSLPFCMDHLNPKTHRPLWRKLN